VSIGLLLSSVVGSSEAAMALTPIALIPQVVLGGTLVPMTTNTLLEYPMWGIPARWGFEGSIVPERLLNAGETGWLYNLPRTKDVADAGQQVLDQLFLKDGGDKLQFICAKAEVAAKQGVNSVNGNFPFDGAWGFTEYTQQWVPLAVLGGMTLVTLIIMMIVLRKKDPV
jgi:hypothetical protein